MFGSSGRCNGCGGYGFHRNKCPLILLLTGQGQKLINQIVNSPSNHHSTPSSYNHGGGSIYSFIGSTDFYHGTSQENCRSIARSGFSASSSGFLGSGVYLAEEGKAENFARDATTRGKGMGAYVIRCKVDTSCVIGHRCHTDSCRIPQHELCDWSIR